jgi:hypothetical protein
MRDLARLTVASLVLVFCCLICTEARADAFVITSGTIVREGLIQGVATYNYAGSGLSVTGRFGEAYLGPSCQGCRSGSIVGFSGQIYGGGGTVIINGESYRVAFGGTLTFSSPAFVLPVVPLNDSQITVTVPFTMTGTLFGCTVGLLICEEEDIPFRATLTGQGFATGLFIQTNPDVREFYLTNVTFNFQPAAVPEPATLLLLGTGLAGVAARVRKRCRVSK